MVCVLTSLLQIYSKAFDRVDTSVTAHKLLQMGVCRELLPWVGDFLTGRKQHVRVNGATPDWFEVMVGEPQGTKLGPVIFLAMVNSVAEHHGDRCKFVDDDGSQEMLCANKY